MLVRPCASSATRCEFSPSETRGVSRRGQVPRKPRIALLRCQAGATAARCVASGGIPWRTFNSHTYARGAFRPSLLSAGTPGALPAGERVVVRPCPKSATAAGLARATHGRARSAPNFAVLAATPRHRARPSMRRSGGSSSSSATGRGSHQGDPRSGGSSLPRKGYVPIRLAVFDVNPMIPRSYLGGLCQVYIGGLCQVYIGGLCQV